MINISSSDGGEFEAYIAMPTVEKAPAIIAISDILGLQEDFKRLCDDFAKSGYIVIAHDCFWRTDDPGVMPLTEEGKSRGLARAQPRQERIEAGMQDIADITAYLKSLPECNGKVAVMGFCYGGPYAILGPARLGLDAGIAFHGSDMHLWIDEFAEVKVPSTLHWGENDHLLSAENLQLFKETTDQNSNIDLHIYDDAPHGYSVPGRPVHAAEAAEHSFSCAREIMATLI